MAAKHAEITRMTHTVLAVSARIPEALITPLSAEHPDQRRASNVCAALVRCIWSFDRTFRTASSTPAPPVAVVLPG